MVTRNEQDPKQNVNTFHQVEYVPPGGGKGRNGGKVAGIKPCRIARESPSGGTWLLPPPTTQFSQRRALPLWEGHTILSIYTA